MHIKRWSVVKHTNAQTVICLFCHKSNKQQSTLSIYTSWCKTATESLFLWVLNIFGRLNYTHKIYKKKNNTIRLKFAFSFLIRFLVKSMKAHQNPHQGSSMRVNAYSLVFSKCVSMHFLLNVSVCVTTQIVVHYDASTCISKHAFWRVYIDCNGKCIKKNPSKDASRANRKKKAL